MVLTFASCIMVLALAVTLLFAINYDGIESGLYAAYNNEIDSQGSGKTLKSLLVLLGSAATIICAILLPAIREWVALVSSVLDIAVIVLLQVNNMN